MPKHALSQAKQAVLNKGKGKGGWYLESGEWRVTAFGRKLRYERQISGWIHALILDEQSE